MKTKITITAALLLTALLFGSCSGTAGPARDTDVRTSEETVPATEEPADPFSAVRASGEEWLAYGLKAYESGKQAENLKTFFSDPANLTYLTLYDHLFTYDKAKTLPVAEAFFAFVADGYGIDALLNMDKRVEYKDAYLKSLGVDAVYNNDGQAEALLASMDFSSDETYQYVFTFDNVTYRFRDFGGGSPQQYHGLLYFSTVGLHRMTAYLRENGLDEGLDTARHFNFYMTFDGTPYSKTVYSTGNMYINHYSSTLHEAMHAMGIRKDSDIWLSEGLCNYFGKALGFNDQIAAGEIQVMKMVDAGYFDELVRQGDKSARQAAALFEEYTAHGGTYDSADGFDFRLYYDISAKAELDGGEYDTLGDVYEALNNKECDSVGKELSYNQATSLIIYLADRCGIGRVMEAYRADNPSDVFGKEYDSLKSDWLAYLESTYASFGGEGNRTDGD